MFMLSLNLVLRQQFIKHRNGKYKQINIKNRTYYFFNDMINIKNFDQSLIETDKISYKIIGICYVGHITIKSISDYENINSVNPLYLIIGDVDGYIEEDNGNKDLTFASTNKNKKVLEKYTKLWGEIKYHIQTINAAKFGEYEKDYMKIKFTSDDDLLLNKILNVIC